MGMGATNTLDRVMASVGQLESVPIRFEASLDVPNGGVLLALPALLANGLLEHTNKYFQLAKGYYGMGSIFLLLSFMALCRVKHPEQLRYCPPGEWGKLLGLDRIPEVRTLREKLSELGTNGQVEPWGAKLCEDWMGACPEASGVLYVDGHVRVYHGEQTRLPRHYVARERLCLRATTDYWVNDITGQPFFLVNQAVDPGMLKVLANEIVPRLDKEVPCQPTEEQLQADPYLHRYVMVFDREGYSPDFLKEMRDKRIACVTYHKHPKEDWPQELFQEQVVELPGGQRVEMKLAELGVMLSNGMWVREIRRLGEGGHQTSILATDYKSWLDQVSVRMFSRWTQENFFRYMREHYSLDRLVDYKTEALDDTIRLVNPAYRELDSKVKSKAALLGRKLAVFGAMTLQGNIEPQVVERFEREKAELDLEIAKLKEELEEYKVQRKAAPRHITAGQLAEKDKFNRLTHKTKHFVDIIKMVAYRAETAMVNIVREVMSREYDARSLLRDIYQMEADLVPDPSKGTLTVSLHHMTTQSADQTVRHLCEELTATETVFPGTNLTMVYRLGPSQNPRDQEV